MSETDKPLITIVGATSKQGRSAAHTLLRSRKYRVRALTRNVDSREAQDLARQGAELVAVPLELRRQKEFVEALRGSQGAFLMTPPIAPPETHEFELGRQLADAAVEAGVRHVVFSGLENVDRITGGRKYAPHFTDKARIEEHIRTLPLISSFVHMAFFFTNLMEYYVARVENGTLVFPIYLPEDFRAPFVDPLTATGPAILEILSHPDEYGGKSLPVIGEFVSPREMVETFSRVTGIEAAYGSAFDREGLLRYFPAFADNEPLVRELLGMAEYAVEYGYYREDRDLAWSRRVDPDSLTWERFLRTSNWQGDRCPSRAETAFDALDGRACEGPRRRSVAFRPTGSRRFG